MKKKISTLTKYLRGNYFRKLIQLKNISLVHSKTFSQEKTLEIITYVNERKC